MTHDQAALDELVREMQIGENEIALRKTFLEFTEADAKSLAAIHEHVEAIHLDEIFANLFYQHLRAFPELRRLIPDDTTLERLKKTQSRYFRDMTNGIYGAEYAESRVRVGLMHQRVGLQPKWYTGAYRKYLSFLLTNLYAQYSKEPEKFITTFDALMKIIFFDMELALDAYFFSDKKKIFHHANHDALTGLPNRNLLLDRINQALRQSNRLDSSVAVLFIDLDRFKNINDSLGHNVGDHVIVEVSHRLSSNLREADTIARLGGDEFAVVLTGIEQEAIIGQLVEKLVRSLHQPIMAGHHELYVSASIGVAVYPMDGVTQEELLKNADAAMYWAKQDGRNTFRFYQREMNEHAQSRLQLDTRLHKALDQDEFRLVFQPQIELASGRLVGAEALIRWVTKEVTVSPAEFIAVAEETGMILSVGTWVLEQACRQAVVWHREGVDPSFRVAVNLSTRQIWEQDLVATISRVLEDTGCQARWLELEITESTLMKYPDIAADTMQVLGEMGVAIAIDDFGTGYSSLAYLKRFQPHSLKIDRSFVGNITINQSDAFIVRAVVSLAHNFGIRVVAEGVEEIMQERYLRKIKCDVVQGFLYSRPVPAEEFGRMIVLPATSWMQERSVCDDLNPGGAAKAENPDFDTSHCHVRWIGHSKAVCQVESMSCIYRTPLMHYCKHPQVHTFGAVN